MTNQYTYSILLYLIKQQNHRNCNDHLIPVPIWMEKDLPKMAAYRHGNQKYKYLISTYLPLSNNQLIMSQGCRWNKLKPWKISLCSIRVEPGTSALELLSTSNCAIWAKLSPRLMYNSPVTLMTSYCDKHQHCKSNVSANISHPAFLNTHGHLHQL